MKNRIIFFSGGKSSFCVADYVKEHFPEDNIVLYFTDTCWEDEDLYRFIKEASDALELPLLIHSLEITPIQLMFEQHVLFNSRIGNCSKVLKSRVAKNYLKKGTIPPFEHWQNKHFLKLENFTENPVLYFGIGFEEMHREADIRRNWKGFEVEMPLIHEYIDREMVMKKYHIKQPRLYDMCFAHNNCKGRCVKAGQGHFKNLKEKMPEVFQKLKEQEHYLKLYVGSYHLIKQMEEINGIDTEYKERELKRLDAAYRDYFYDLKDKPDIFIPPYCQVLQYSFMKKDKKPYPLREFETLLKKQEKTKSQQMTLELFNPTSCLIDEYDIGGCSCFVEFDNEE